MVPNINKHFCVYCQNHSGSVALLRHFVSLPTFLMTELSSDCIVAFILFFFLLNKKNEMKIHVHIYSKKTRTTSKPKVTLQYHKILL